MRALAWWHAIPQPPPSKLKNAPKLPPNRLSRMKALKDGVEPDLPEIEPELQFLIAYLFDAGPTSAGGQSQVTLTWIDLRAWQDGAGIALPPWQLRLLRRLSAEYLSESFTADAHDAPPPWERDLTPDQRARVSKHVRNILRG